MLQTATLAFLAGILLLQTQAVLPSEWWLFSLPLVLVGCLAFRRRILILLCCFLAGFLWAQYQANNLLRQRLPAPLEHKTLQVRGYIASLPVRTADRIRFEFDIIQIEAPALKQFPHKVRLSWYTHEPPVLRPGDEWMFKLRLHSPHDFMSPGAFDYNAWLLQQGIVAVGYVYNKAGSNHRLGRSGWRYPAQSIRYHYQQSLHRILADNPAAGLITALVIGDRSAISKEDWTQLQRTGTVHLMAISGLHVGMIAGFVFFIVTQIWRRLPRACLLYPAPKIAAMVAWLAALLYSGLAGFAVPTQRALVMLTVILLSVCLQRTHKPTQVLAIALLLVLVWDPLSVLSVGFWLSFGAVGLIYYLLHVLPRSVSGKTGWWRMQFAISLGLTPLLILFFQQAAVLSPLNNLIAIPWVGMLVLPLAMLSVLLMPLSQTIAGVGLHMAAALMHLLQQLLQWSASLKWSLIQLPAPTMLSLLLALTGFLILLLPRSVPARYLGLLLILPLCLPARNAPGPGEVRLSLLDVGQGLSTLVQTAHHSLLFDTGPRFGQTLDASQSVILPYLVQQHISKIDTLLVSHSDMDHIGGVQTLMNSIPVDHVISSVPRLLRDHRGERCLAGRDWQWDGVRFQILHPSRHEYDGATSDNNRSCVLQIRTGTQQVLLTGDIEAPAEMQLVDRYGETLRSSILIIPHHGSRTSSTPAFVETVNPALALIPTGWHNRFHFPASSVIDRLRAHRARVLDTASSGTIQVEVKPALQITTYRALHRRYWQVW